MKQEMKQEMKQKRATVSLLDARIAVAVFICCITATCLNYFGIKFAYGQIQLEIVQKMTACIACLLCCQDDVEVSYRSGVNRLIITVIGGMIGIGVVFLDNCLNSVWIMTVLVALGVLLTLFLCKLSKVPYINARIGGVTFILVSCTLGGSARIWYAIFRFVSTLYGVLIVVLITWLFNFIEKKRI